MIKNFKSILAVLMMAAVILSCKKDSVLGADFVTVRAAIPVIDTTAQTIDVLVNLGTDLKNVYPQFTLATDCKLDPKITGRTDLSDLANPKIYTVVSGNRKTRKAYKLNIKFQ
jgi:hypothetical protein